MKENGVKHGIEEGKMQQSTTMQGGDRVEARFMEVDGKINEILGDDGGIRVIQRNQDDKKGSNRSTNRKKNIVGDKIFENVTVVVDPKHGRVNSENIMEGEGCDISTGPKIVDG